MTAAGRTIRGPTSPGSDRPAQVAAAAPTARLVVARTSDRDVKYREIHLYLDGTRVGQLVYGQRLDRPIEPGEHTLRAYNTLLSRRVSFRVGPGETARFATGNVEPGCLLGFLIVLGAGPLSLFLEPDTGAPAEQLVERR